MRRLFHSHSPLRIFFISGSITLILLGGVWAQLGFVAFMTAVILTVVELTFSFDNAIINARVLQRMSPFWQQMFMTIGILIAVFGMRIVFPIAMVMLAAGLGWSEVINLALNDPHKYADILDDSHPSMASFGGMFLLMLGLTFFFDHNRKVFWLRAVEKPLQKVGRWWMATAVSLLVIISLTLHPSNEHPQQTITAGLFGIVTYIIIHGLADLLARRQEKQFEHGAAVVQTGLAGFMSFMYLEVLDASFSLDGVIGAFAITQNVILIAIGLGIGALWVRSLTLFMVRRRTLNKYRYLDHGAHYTIAMLAAFLLSGLFIHLSEFVPGLAGIAIIGLAIASSIRSKKKSTI